MLTLLGTLCGGLFRMLPEIFKYLDKKDERKHELSMLNAQLEADRARSSLRIDELHAQQNYEEAKGEITLLDKAVSMQGQLTGNKFADACNTLMRPLITFWWCIVLYSAALISQFVVLVSRGTSTPEAIIALWGADEKAIVASVISFWFVDRSIRKLGK